MPTTRSRIVRRAVMALAVVVMVPVWYACSVQTIFIASEAGLLPGWFATVGYAYITPWIWYVRDSQWVGSEECKYVTQWFSEKGRELGKLL